MVDKVYLDKGYQYDKTPVQTTASSGDSEPAKKRFSGGEGVVAKKRSGMFDFPSLALECSSWYRFVSHPIELSPTGELEVTSNENHWINILFELR